MRHAYQQFDPLAPVPLVKEGKEVHFPILDRVQLVSPRAVARSR